MKSCGGERQPTVGRELGCDMFCPCWVSITYMGESITVFSVLLIVFLEKYLGSGRLVLETRLEECPIWGLYQPAAPGPA